MSSHPESILPTPEKPREAASVTPLMRQYLELKAGYPDELLFFRLGDFYELFDQDAQRAAPILEVALTRRQETPMCGVPAHAIDPYIAKVLKAGFRVALADQLEEAGTTKGLVKRGVVRVITPGTLQEDSLLAAKRSNFLVAMALGEDRAGLAAIECSTGEFIATEQATTTSAVWDELIRLQPSEVILPQHPQSETWKIRLAREGMTVASLPDSEFSVPIASERLNRVFGTASLRGFGLEDKPLALGAAGAALRYLENTQCGRPFSLRSLRTYSLDDYLSIDASTLRHLDIAVTGDGRPGRSLLSVLDQTLTAMGGRMLRQWLLAPLKNVERIQDRQAVVEFFLENREFRRHLRAVLQGWPDLERILTRIRAQSASPRDLANMAQGLKRIRPLKTHLANAYTQATALQTELRPTLENLLKDFPEAPNLADQLERALSEHPPALLADGQVIKPGFHAELDEIRSWIHDGKARVLELERKEKDATGISNLRVGFNNVFGYYIEVTRSNVARVPMHYTRKQTTANAERYITSELKEFEGKILGAQERALRLETALFKELCAAVLDQGAQVQAIAVKIAELDSFLSLAEVAERHHYTKPKIDSSRTLKIEDGRHPILDELLSPGTLVPNDVDLDAQDRQIIVLTGPNMSGKSTYLRQTALMVIMAQMGSFVPAASAHVGIVDQVFSRIGASDRLADGESTFMVEMVETAHILNHVTDRSLVILDEVGRGTSTYDGISIAWACLEYLQGLRRTTREPGPKVLFATHYFELTQLADRLRGVQNAHVSAKEWGDDVIFLHKIEPGPADRAYGIHVARLAGVPASVLQRAETLLAELQAPQSSPKDAQPDLFATTAAALPVNRKKGVLPAVKATTVQRPDPTELQLQKDLEDLNINELTPLQALLKLQEWKEKLKQSRS